MAQFNNAKLKLLLYQPNYDISKKTSSKRRGKSSKIEKNPVLIWLFKCFKFLLHWKKSSPDLGNQRGGFVAVRLVKKHGLEVTSRRRS